MKVFLSSTAQDLDAYRQVADDTILRLAQESIVMERFGPKPNAPIEECERLASKSDVVVCIVAHRYGSVPEPGKGSFTEREVRAAKNAGKDVLVWIIADDFPWTEGKEQDLLTNPDVLADGKRVETVVTSVKSLAMFKAWLRESFVCEMFTTPDDLGRKISITLKTRGTITERPKVNIVGIRSEAELRVAYEKTAKSRYPCDGAGLDDLDWSLVDLLRQRELPDVSADGEQSILLDQLGLFSPLSAMPTLHNAAVLCFCKRPHRYLPQAVSNFIVGDPGDPSFILEPVTGPLSQQVKELVALTVERLSNVSKFNEGGLRTEESEIPLPVVREAISNAVAHRDYDISGNIQVRLTDSHLEIQNPGSFPPDASWQSFLSARLVSRPLDMAVAFYLKRLLAVEAIGRGFAVFRNHIAVFGDDSIEWEVPAPSTVLMRIKRFKPELRSVSSVSGTRHPYELTQDQISISRLPSSGQNLFGRDSELRVLDQAWEDSNTNVFTIVAWGGVGKTALVNHWLKNRMARNNYRGAESVYGWSFFSQGTSERAASADLFIDQALRWFGDKDPTAGSPWDKGERLASYIRQRRTLLILDGLEPLQHPPGPHEGGLKDAALQALLVELAGQQPGLCVITTREPVRDLGEFEGSTVVQHHLDNLSPSAGSQILRSMKVRGDDEELEAASREFSGHALSLTLLGSYLDELYLGDIRRRKEVENLFADTRYGDKAQAMIVAYEKWLGEGMELSILRLLGFFDRPADAASLDALREPPVIPGLTEPLQDFKGREWNQAVAKLRRIKLLAEPSSNEPGTLDAHPLVREHFKQQLKLEHPAAWREGNNRLYEHLARSTKEFPDSIEEMSPLYAAVAHGCAAGHYEETLEDIYVRRIQRGNEYFGVRKLGAFAAELSALAAFFEIPWEKPVINLIEPAKAFVLSSAGVHLRALGRLQEAAQPLRAGLDTSILREDWQNAAISAGNLSELQLRIGNLPEAIETAAQSVDLTNRAHTEFQRVLMLTTLADALHLAGDWAKSLATFKEAESLQRKLRPQYPFLYSLQGFRYCDLLLDQEQLEAVKERAAKTHEWAKQDGGLLDLALVNLLLARALFLESQAAGGSDASKSLVFLQRAMERFRQAGQIDYLPLGLLAQAQFHRFVSDYQRAERDLAEIFRIATPGGMNLYLADYHLESARLRLAQGDKEKAREHWTTAKKMIDDMGYHRRDKEVKELEHQLGETGQ